MTETNPTGMVAYGARCMWWDEKANVAQKPSGLPCCPHCGGVLFECEVGSWWHQAQVAVDRGDVRPDYLAFLRWLRGRCYPARDVAEAVYDEDRAFGRVPR